MSAVSALGDDHFGHRPRDLGEPPSDLFETRHPLISQFSLNPVDILHIQAAWLDRRLLDTDDDALVLLQIQRLEGT